MSRSSKRKPPARCRRPRPEDIPELEVDLPRKFDPADYGPDVPAQIPEWELVERHLQRKDALAYLAKFQHLPETPKYRRMAERAWS